MRQRSRSYRDPADDEDSLGEDLASVNERIDALTRQLERMVQVQAAPSHAPVADERADRVSDALARLDRRLDQVISDGRSAAGEFHRTRYAPAPQPSPQHYAPPPPQPQQHYAPPPQQHYAPQPQPYAPPAGPAPAAARSPASWAAQIAARQRTLDVRPAAAAAPVAQPAPVPIPPQAAPQQNWVPAPTPAPAPAPVPAPDFSALEQQLQHINTQISALHQPYENALAALRGDLAEIGRALNDALPRRAIEALEGEVRALAEQVDRTRQAGSNGQALAALEHELAEVRNALHHLTPAENLSGFEDAVRGLYHKIDQIAAAGGPPQGDPMAFRQLEQAVVSLRGIVSNVASDGALAQLAAEVRGMAAQFERTTHESGSEALGRLETRIAALMENGRAVPPELEGTIRQLSERLDRMQLSQGDQLALGALENRIAKLSEKLDASDARLGHLEAIERGLADLLVYLEEMRSTNARALRAPPAEPEPVPVAPPRPMPMAPAQAPVYAPAPAPAPAFAQSPLDLIPDQPLPPAPTLQMAPQPPAATFAPPPQPAPPPAPPPAPAPVQQHLPAAAPARLMPRGPQRQPIDPNLPPDTPLEPGSGAPRVRPGSAAARIAASQAALGHTRSMAEDIGSKSAAIAAARNAAKAAYLDTPVKVPKSLRRTSPGFLKWPFKKKAAEDDVLQPQPVHIPATMPAPAPIPAPQPMPSTMPPPMQMQMDDALDEAPLSGGKKALRVLKTALVAASVAIIVIGVAETAMEFLFPAPSQVAPGAPPQAPSKNLESRNPETRSPADTAPRTQAPSVVPSRPMPTPDGGAPAPSAPNSDPDHTNSINGNPSSFFDPNTVIKLPDVTGSIPRKPKAAAPGAPAGRADIDTLPSSVGAALRTAALANEPAAEYEIGTRYADGRNGPPNIAEAARWFEKAADAGFAPAQFRLASMNEKGDGVKKDTQTARRLYIAAAGQGHAKSMHNLAVLYAEGIDGKPDYKTAAEWFRKAASYGVNDSQFNLAILYARGIGVSVNLAEAYRWFALAAASGDTDATRKRDEVASRLDSKTLMMAKQAVESFVADREPDAAINLKAPPGGWDHTAAAQAKAKR